VTDLLDEGLVDELDLLGDYGEHLDVDAVELVEAGPGTGAEVVVFC